MSTAGETLDFEQAHADLLAELERSVDKSSSRRETGADDVFTLVFSPFPRITSVRDVVKPWVTISPDNYKDNIDAA